MSRAHAFYAELAGWWPLISPVEDYAEEAARYASILTSASGGEPRTLLELGSGGGHNAFHLKGAFERVTLVDAATGMLDVSRALNPECVHVQGDMRTVRLPEAFDCVFVHDAICYATSLEEVRAVLETVRAHLRPGGIALIVPDFVRETFREGTHHGGTDDGDRGIRFLEWVHDPDPTDCTYVVDYAFLIREGGDVPRVIHDRHVEGLFSTDEWCAALRGAGLEPEVVQMEETDDAMGVIGLVGRVGWAGRQASASRDARR